MNIEKNIPIPPRFHNKRNKQFDAIDWSVLEVGDSFVISAKTSGGLHKRAKAAGIQIEIRVARYEKSQFSNSINSPCEFRVWRIA